jgi:hypothetical protein
MAKKEGTKRTVDGGPWDEVALLWKAMALQTLVRELEKQAVAAYMGDASRFDEIAHKIGAVLDDITPGKGKSYTCTSCPPGYFCCCSRCKPMGERCPLCLTNC